MWQYSLRDLKNVVELKVGEKVADSRQNYTNLVDVVSAIFGGKKTDVVDEQFIAQNADHARALFRSVIGGR